jgi:hypothetical protein
MSNEKRKIHQSSNLNNLVEGWIFNFIEVSPNYYRIEGKDKWGHSVSRTCSEMALDETLEKCSDDARDIQKQIQEN